MNCLYFAAIDLIEFKTTRSPLASSAARSDCANSPLFTRSWRSLPPLVVGSSSVDTRIDYTVYK